MKPNVHKPTKPNCTVHKSSQNYRGFQHKVFTLFILWLIFPLGHSQTNFSRAEFNDPDDFDPYLVQTLSWAEGNPTNIHEFRIDNLEFSIVLDSRGILVKHTEIETSLDLLKKSTAVDFSSLAVNHKNGKLILEHFAKMGSTYHVFQGYHSQENMQNEYKFFGIHDFATCQVLVKVEASTVVETTQHLIDLISIGHDNKTVWVNSVQDYQWGEYLVTFNGQQVFPANALYNESCTIVFNQNGEVIITEDIWS